jgi:hypothetical protein
MSTLTRTMIQEALDAASLDLKQWTSILLFVILSLDRSGASVDSEIPDLLLSSSDLCISVRRFTLLGSTIQSQFVLVGLDLCLEGSQHFSNNS